MALSTKRKRPSDELPPLVTDFVYIHVEKDGICSSYKLPRYLLTKHSKVLSSIFNLPVIHRVQLKDVDEDVLNRFGMWLKFQYVRELMEDGYGLDHKILQDDWTFIGTDLVRTRDEKLLKWGSSVGACIEMVAFAEKFNISLLKRDAIDWILRCCLSLLRGQSDWSSCFRVSALKLAYIRTKHCSALRQLVLDSFFLWPHQADVCSNVDIILATVKEMDLEKGYEEALQMHKTYLLEVPKEFLADVVIKLRLHERKLGLVEKFDELHKCDYHGHENDEEKKRCGPSRVKDLDDWLAVGAQRKSERPQALN